LIGIVILVWLWISALKPTFPLRPPLPPGNLDRPILVEPGRIPLPDRELEPTFRRCLQPALLLP
jgi:hypothetical protein